MPNRILKESICSSETIDKLSSFEETFFYRLIVNCDDYGRMDARPSILKAKLYPLKDVRVDLVAKTLSALVSAGTIEVYDVDGKPYLQMLAWGKHQSIRADKSKYPDKPTEAVAQPTKVEETPVKAHESNCKQVISDASNGNQMSPYSYSYSYSNARTGAREEKPSLPLGKRVRDESAELFDVFWANYPRKTAKENARKAWTKLKPDKDCALKLIAAVKAQAKWPQWTKDDGQYIPHPATWINQRRWEDEAPEAKPPIPSDSPERNPYMKEY